MRESYRVCYLSPAFEVKSLLFIFHPPFGLYLYLTLISPHQHQLTTYTRFNQWHNLLSEEHPLQRSLFTVSPPSHYLLTSFIESSEVFPPVPSAISDLSGPILECDDDPESDLIDPCGLGYQRPHYTLQVIILTSSTARSVGRSDCCKQASPPRMCHCQRVLLIPRPRCKLSHLTLPLYDCNAHHNVHDAECIHIPVPQHCRNLCTEPARDPSRVLRTLQVRRHIVLSPFFIHNCALFNS